MSAIDKSGELTANLCRAKAKDCPDLAQQASSESDRIMLEQIAGTWLRITDSLPTNDA